MVSFRSSFILLATVINLALSFPIEERSLSDVEADFETARADLAVVTNEIGALPGSGVDGLNQLNTDTSKLIADVVQTTSDVTSTGNLGEADSETLLTQEAGPAAEELINLLDLFVTQRPAFDQLAAQVPDLIADTEDGLEQFAGIVQNLMDALDANSPPDVVSAAAGLTSSVAGAFATAIAVYSS